jgi:hypothetical protein
VITGFDGAGASAVIFNLNYKKCYYTYYINYSNYLYMQQLNQLI